ncbi:hypothetical protein [Roseospira goensis]|uniref:Uncharacterized protein n=1 Tax=Roseospira goensis TaxID=391922 RepID=A0A7W6S2S1_9PROT|nr:hypothetical protein [Roseospira goensis]MBB4287825.1 hypothetical protein [Roseospira goensis]
MPLSPEQQAALARLALYTSDPWDESAAPRGFGDGGHIQADPDTGALLVDQMWADIVTAAGAVEQLAGEVGPIGGLADEIAALGAIAAEVTACAGAIADIQAAPAAATTAAGSATAAADSAIAAEAARDTAQGHATAAADSATGSAGSAAAAADSASAAGASATATETARTAAEGARDTAQGHATAASDSATAAGASATAAGAARTAAEGARDTAQGHATAATSARTAAEGARDTAQGHATAAGGARTGAETAAALAQAWADSEGAAPGGAGTKSAREWAAEAQAIAGGDFAPSTHTHAAAALTSGTLDIARLPPLILTPQIAAPAHGATGLALAPSLAATPYASLTSTRHAATRWQVLDDATAAVVYDSGASADLTAHTVPAGLLAPGGRYRVQARHGDDAGTWSAPSAPALIRTREALGVALIAPGGGGGTWQRVDEHGGALGDPAYALGGSAWADHPVWGGMTPEEIDGQHMVRIPAFWSRAAPITSGPLAGATAWWVGDAVFDGAVLHPAFRADGGVVDAVWIGAYQGTDDAGLRVASQPGAGPLTGLTLDAYRARCQARDGAGSAGWDLWSVYHWSAVQMLALIEMGGSDSQALIGPGRVAETGPAAVDAADVATASYRGLVGLWGNVAQWLAGLRTGAAGTLEIADFNGYGTWADTGLTAATTAHYPLTMLHSAGPGYDLRDVFLAEAADAASGSAATWPDRHVIAAAPDRVPAVGGAWDAGPDAGLWALTLDHAPTDASAAIGGRLVRVPG